jgi:hypothetical protein
MCRKLCPFDRPFGPSLIGLEDERGKLPSAQPLLQVLCLFS